MTARIIAFCVISTWIGLHGSSICAQIPPTSPVPTPISIQPTSTDKPASPVKLKPPRGPNTPADIKTSERRCVPGYNHHYGAAKKDTCTVSIDEQNAVSPLPLRVTKGMSVQIIVKRSSNLEIVQFVPTNAAVQPIDLGASLFANLSGIMTGFVALRLVPSHSGPQALDQPIQRPFDVTVIVDAQERVKKRLDTESQKLTDLKTNLDKLGNLAGSEFDNQLSSFLTATKDLPFSESADPNPPCGSTSITVDCGSIELQLKSTDIQIASDVAQCASDSIFTDCKSRLIEVQQRQAVLASALAKIQNNETALKAAHEKLADLPASGDYIYEILPSKNVTSSVKISSRSVLSGTSTDLATLSVTWQTTPFFVSAGLMISTMPGRTFTNGAQIVDGTPNGIVSVSKTASKPSWVTPLALFNYEALASRNAD